MDETTGNSRETNKNMKKPARYEKGISAYDSVGNAAYRFDDLDSTAALYGLREISDAEMDEYDFAQGHRPHKRALVISHDCEAIAITSGNSDAIRRLSAFIGNLDGVGYVNASGTRLVVLDYYVDYSTFQMDAFACSYAHSVGLAVRRNGESRPERPYWV
jgi:hypothetical protein